MLILLLFAQLTPQLAAEANGLRFLSKKGVYTLTYTGTCKVSLYSTHATLYIAQRYATVWFYVIFISFLTYDNFMYLD